jgi:phosphoglycerate kinase
MKTLKDANIKNKKVILRVDFNVIIQNGQVTEDFRMRATLPTINYLLENGAKRIVILSHFGRPNGERNSDYSLAPAAKHLSDLLKKDVEFQETIESAEKFQGRIALLENLRFYKGEEENDEVFFRELSRLGEVFVQDAFGVCHREHASIVGVPKLLPSYAGFLLEKEVSTLSGILENPKRPLTILIGGAKISTKMAVIEKFLDFADNVCLGGALANIVLKAKGMAVGRSIIEESMLEKVKEIEFTNTHLHLPIDVKISEDKDASNGIKIKGAGNVEDDEIILDIGPDTQQLFANVIHKSKTVVWNGPMGYLENKKFAEGTEYIAREIASAGEGVLTVVGGGDTYMTLENLGVMQKISFISTGGGAMLDFLSKGTLSGIEALK